MIAVVLVAMLGGPAPTVWVDARPVSALLAEAPQDPLYKQGTAAIDRGDWDAAVKAVGELARQKGERADAALYWQAYALYKGGQPDAALEPCATLKTTYPQSRWQRDRRALELEIRQATGQTPLVVEKLASAALVASDHSPLSPLKVKMSARRSPLKSRASPKFGPTSAPESCPGWKVPLPIPRNVVKLSCTPLITSRSRIRS